MVASHTALARIPVEHELPGGVAIMHRDGDRLLSTMLKQGSGRAPGSTPTAARAGADLHAKTAPLFGGAAA